MMRIVQSERILPRPSTRTAIEAVTGDGIMMALKGHACPQQHAFLWEQARNERRNGFACSRGRTRWERLRLTTTPKAWSGRKALFGHCGERKARLPWRDEVESMFRGLVNLCH